MDSSYSESEVLRAKRCIANVLARDLSYPIHFRSRADSSYSETEALQVGRCVLNAPGRNLSLGIHEATKGDCENLLYPRDDSLRRARHDSLVYRTPQGSPPLN